MERLKAEVRCRHGPDNFKDINDTFATMSAALCCARSPACCAGSGPTTSAPLRGRRVHRRAVGMQRRGGRAKRLSCTPSTARSRRGPAAAAARDQHRRRRLPARRRFVRHAAGHRGQPDVPRQDLAQARERGRPCGRRTRAISTAREPHRRRRAPGSHRGSVEVRRES